MKNAQRGAGMVEFAVVATVFLLLLFGIVDFGRAVFTYHAVANAAREGSRYAMVRGSSCAVSGCPATSASIQTYVRGRNSTLMVPSSITVTASWPGITGCTAGGNTAGCEVAVTVTYPFHFAALPFADIPMSSTSTMIISQ